VIALWRLVARYRRALILASTLLLAFFLMTLQVRHDQAVVSFARRAVLLAISPALHLTALITGSAGQVWQDYVDLRDLRAENRHLAQDAALLKRRIGQLEEQALETQRLQRLLALRQDFPASYVAARVVGKDATNWFKTLLVDQGTSSGVRRNLPVLSPDGLVGRVVEVTAASAKIQLVTDPLSAAGGLIQRTRVTGIVAGGLGTGLRVRYLPLMANIVVGDEVVTSGMGGLFPKGIPLGRITAVERKSGALFQEAILQPAVDLSRLEEVLILTGTPGREGFETGSARP
jgi:rod shape-determining protein MreC